MVTLFVSYLCAGCSADESRIHERTPENDKTSIQEALSEWLESECPSDRALHRVVSYRDEIVDGLFEALAYGPKQSTIEAAKSRAIAKFRAKSGAGNSDLLLPEGEEKYTRSMVGQFIVNYQVRAAQALGLIGGINAQEALLMANPANPAVQRAIELALVHA